MYLKLISCCLQYIRSAEVHLITTAEDKRAEKSTGMTPNSKPYTVLVLPSLTSEQKQRPHAGSRLQARYQPLPNAALLLKTPGQRRAAATSTTHVARTHFSCWLRRAPGKKTAPEPAPQQEPAPNTRSHPSHLSPDQKAERAESRCAYR